MLSFRSHVTFRLDVAQHRMAVSLVAPWQGQWRGLRSGINAANRASSSGASSSDEPVLHSASDTASERKRLWMAAIKPPMYSVGVVPVLVSECFMGQVYCVLVSHRSTTIWPYRCMANVLHAGGCRCRICRTGLRSLGEMCWPCSGFHLHHRLAQSKVCG